jgi:hypothetical protein
VVVNTFVADVVLGLLDVLCTLVVDARKDDDILLV